MPNIFGAFCFSDLPEIGRLNLFVVAVPGALGIDVLQCRLEHLDAAILAVNALGDFGKGISVFRWSDGHFWGGGNLGGFLLGNQLLASGNQSIIY